LAITNILFYYRESRMETWAHVLCIWWRETWH